MNLEKCIFGVSKGKLLGCLVSAIGIEANLEKLMQSSIWNPHFTKASAEAHRKARSAKQIHLKVHGARAPIL